MKNESESSEEAFRWNACPICGEAVHEPPEWYGEVECPHCGTRLWHIRWGAGVRFYVADRSEHARQRLLQRLAEHLGVEAGRLDPQMKAIREQFEADSLDIVELVMELEEEFEQER